MRYLAILLLLVVNYVYAADLQLVIQQERLKKNYSRSMLMTQFKIASITMDSNRAYPGQMMTYDAVRLCDLLQGYPVKANNMIEFEAADGFSVLVPAKLVTTCNDDAAIGYLAIEPQKKWPLLFNKTGTTAGPFAVIWMHPEKSYISNEYWAWSVVKIIVHQKNTEALVIAPPKTTDASVLRGHTIYVSHCAGCHTMNGIGKGHIGPAFNRPKNPVEYYPDDKKLRQFIRDPQSVRGEGRMSGSGEDFLNNKDLNYLIAYFHYMVKHKNAKANS